MSKKKKLFTTAKAANLANDFQKKVFRECMITFQKSSLSLLKNPDINEDETIIVIGTTLSALVLGVIGPKKPWEGPIEPLAESFKQSLIHHYNHCVNKDKADKFSISVVNNEGDNENAQ